MLTRRQVAARLGKSIATVRRLEGVHLHPRRDTQGVYRFDVVEVEQFAAAHQRGAVPRAGAPQSTDWRGWLRWRLAHHPSRPPAAPAHLGRTVAVAAESELADLRRCTSALARLFVAVATDAQRLALGAEVTELIIELAAD